MSRVVPALLAVLAAGCFDFGLHAPPDPLGASVIEFGDDAITLSHIPLRHDLAFGVTLHADATTHCQGRLSGWNTGRDGVIAATVDTRGTSWITYKTNAAGPGIYVGPAGNDVGVFPLGYFELEVDADPFEGERTLWFLVPSTLDGGRWSLDLSCPGATLADYHAGSHVDGITWANQGDAFTDHTAPTWIAAADAFHRTTSDGTTLLGIWKGDATATGVLTTPDGTELLDPDARGRFILGGPGDYSARIAATGGYVTGIFAHAAPIDDPHRLFYDMVHAERFYDPYG